MPRPPRVQNTHKRWDQNGPAAQFMREIITSGEIDISQQPKSTFDTCPSQFEGHTLDQVRAHMSKMRTSEGKLLLDQGTLKQLYN